MLYTDLEPWHRQLHPDWQGATLAHRTHELWHTAQGTGFMSQFHGPAPGMGHTKASCPFSKIPLSFPSLHCERQVSPLAYTSLDPRAELLIPVATMDP
jgi:hypothetical protein